MAPELKRNTKSEGEEEKSCVFGVSCSPLLAWFSSWIFFNFRDLERRGMKPKLRAAKSQTVCVVFLFTDCVRLSVGSFFCDFIVSEQNWFQNTFLFQNFVCFVSR